MTAGKCDPCGREFTGLGAFDKHQDVNYDRRPPVICQDPAAVGLVQQESGRWGFPITDAAREVLRSLRAKQAPVHTPVTPQDGAAAESRYGASP